MKRNRIPHDSVDPSVAIRINRVNGRSLNKIAIENAGGDRFIGNPRKTQFGNRTGIVYTYEYKGNNHIGFMFLSPDGQHAIQVSYDPASDLNAETADRVINSFSFPR
ncbi:MAG: hypothetical protein MUC48_13795 [Leptolyngbya sp. Prado105]|jgi:hypothetical protein|nr:hypothetical protein [Leptolyngbya sp. Prado105]